MDKSISILDKDYLQWVQELCKRYQRCQIKAAVKVNQEMLRFYWGPTPRNQLSPNLGDNLTHQ